MSCPKIQPFSSQITLASNNRMQSGTKHVEERLGEYHFCSLQMRSSNSTETNKRGHLYVHIQCGSFISVCLDIWNTHWYTSMPWYFVILWEGSLGGAGYWYQECRSLLVILSQRPCWKFAPPHPTRLLFCD